LRLTGGIGGGVSGKREPAHYEDGNGNTEMLHGTFLSLSTSRLDATPVIRARSSRPCARSM